MHARENRHGGRQQRPLERAHDVPRLRVLGGHGLQVRLRRHPGANRLGVIGGRAENGVHLTIDAPQRLDGELDDHLRARPVRVRELERATPGTRSPDRCGRLRRTGPGSADRPDRRTPRAADVRAPSAPPATGASTRSRRPLAARTPRRSGPWPPSARTRRERGHRRRRQPRAPRSSRRCVSISGRRFSSRPTLPCPTRPRYDSAQRSWRARTAPQPGATGRAASLR